MFRLPAVLIVFLSLLPAFVQAQRYDELLRRAGAGFMQENMHLHLSQPAYVSGETIWFKAYFFSNGLPGTAASNFYLQLTDAEGAIVESQKYPIARASAAGQIALPDSLPSGHYLLSAWTPLSLNFGQAGIYRRTIAIHNSVKKTANMSSGGRIAQIEFFPESGHLVDGIISLVAFKATDAMGRPVAVSGGLIKNEAGQTIAPFNTYHDGMGIVRMRPQAGQKYLAEILEDNKSRNFPLPAVQKSGVSVKIDQESGGKQFTIYHTPGTPGELDEITLVVETGGQVIFEQEISLAGYPSVRGHLRTDSLPSGILHFTVFNKKGEVLADRLCFVNNREYEAGVTVSWPQVNRSARGKNQFTLSFGQGPVSIASVSVSAAENEPGGDGENMISRMLLSRHLKFPVHQPSWYFRGPADSARQAMDMMLMTQRHAQTDWAALAATAAPAQRYQEHYLLQMRGRALDYGTKLPLNGGRLTFYFPHTDTSSLQYEAAVSDEGLFMLDSLLTEGIKNVGFVYTGPGGKEMAATIQLMDDPADAAAAEMPGLFPAGRLPGLNVIDLPLQARIERHEQPALLLADTKTAEPEKQEEGRRDKKEKKEDTNEKYTNGLFSARSKYTFDLERNPPKSPSQSVLDFITQQIQDVQLRGGGFVNLRQFSFASGNWPVAVYLNQAITGISQIATIRMRDVALVKFFGPGFLGATTSVSTGGAIAIYLRQGEQEEGKKDTPGFEYFSFRGYTPRLVPEQPPYPNAPQIRADRRQLLYWNAALLSDGRQVNIPAEFYNNDAARKFRLVLEGFDANGKLIYSEQEF